MHRSITALAIASTLLLSGAGMAQDASAGRNHVTAQRRAQDLQQVPISITAFDGNVMQRMNITEAPST